MLSVNRQSGRLRFAVFDNVFAQRTRKSNGARVALSVFIALRVVAFGKAALACRVSHLVFLVLSTRAACACSRYFVVE